MANHVALVVEDDPHIVAALTELLASLGHGVVHAATLEEAGRAIEAGGYCYALLDMQIPANAEARALVSAGETALAWVRKREPRRNELGRHWLQILVVSSYSRAPEFVSRMHEMDADAFIPKPWNGRAWS